VIPLTLAIPEHIRGDYDNALYKSTFTYLLLADLSPLAAMNALVCWYNASWWWFGSTDSQTNKEPQKIPY